MKTCRFVCFLLALAPAIATGQTVTGEIRGTVRDSSGGVLPGVTVTATNTQTGLKRTETTSGAGLYVIPSLPIGTYTVAAELQGFRKNCWSSHRPLLAPAGVSLVSSGKLSQQRSQLTTRESPCISDYV